MPEDSEAAARVQKASSFLKWLDDSLFMMRRGNWVLVPPVAVRREAVEERHVLLKHAGINKLVSSLRSEYWWNTLMEDVTTVVKECDSC